MRPFVDEECVRKRRGQEPEAVVIPEITSRSTSYPFTVTVGTLLAYETADAVPVIEAPDTASV